MRTALERRESRRTLNVIVIVALFMPFIGTCGAGGIYKARRTQSAVVKTSPSAVANVETGSYVETDLRVVHVALDGLPLERDEAATARGGALFLAVNDPSVFVYCERSSCAPLLMSDGEPVHLRGQVCDGDSPIACPLPSGLRDLMAQDARPRVRALLVGREPKDEWGDAAAALVVAAGMLLFLTATLVAILWERRGKRMSAERAIALPAGVEEARAALLADATLRLAADRGGELVFLTGPPANRASVLQVRGVGDVPLRIAATFERSHPYHGAAMATVRVTELFPSLIGVPRSCAPMVQSALAAALEQIERRLRAT